MLACASLPGCLMRAWSMFHLFCLLQYVQNGCCARRRAAIPGANETVYLSVLQRKTLGR